MKKEYLISIVLLALFVFVVLVPLSTLGGWQPQGFPGENVTILTPPQDSCVRGDVCISWNISLSDWVHGAIFECDTECLVDWLWWPPIACPAPGCINATWDSSSITCEEVCIGVWNSTTYGTPPWNPEVQYRNYTNFIVDNVDPCIECNSPINGEWFNGTAPVKLNVSVCDNCCGIHEVTANISAVSNQGVVEFTNTSESSGTICDGYPERCEGFYWTYTITPPELKTSCGIRNITVTARDNATDMNGQNNTATCELLMFGVDKDAPDKVEDAGCEELDGAIRIFWADKGYDACSGVDHYVVYGTRDDGVSDIINDSVPAKATGTAECLFTGADEPFAAYCHNYTFNVTAVDKAGNEGPHSNETEEQHLKPGPGMAFFIAHFMTPEGESYPFDLTISDGTWRKEFKNVTYVETEVPCDATYTMTYNWQGHFEMYQFTIDYLSPGDCIESEFYAIDIPTVVPRAKPYLLGKEVGAIVNLSWHTESGMLIYDVQVGPLGKGALVGSWIKQPKLYPEPSSYVKSFQVVDNDTLTVDSCNNVDDMDWDDKSLYLSDCEGNWYYAGEMESDFKTFHVVVGYAEVEENRIPVGVRRVVYNDYWIQPYGIRLSGNSPEYLYPQWTVLPGSYIIQLGGLPQNYAGLSLSMYIRNETHVDIHPPKISELMPFTFSVGARFFFANCSYSNLMHNGDSISINVNTDLPVDWWGYFVLPDNITVESIRSRTRGTL